MMENTRNYTRVAYVTSSYLLRRRASRINFHSAQILNENTALVRTTPLLVDLCKPMYSGASVLELSKLHMLDFFYRKLYATFHSPPRKTLSLHATDTDSFIFSVSYPPGSEESFLTDLPSILDSLDLSSYPKSHPIYSVNAHIPHFETLMMKNKGIVGKFKDELMGEGNIDKVVALKPKLYAYRIAPKEDHGGGDGGQHLVCKGVSTHVKNTELTYEMYEHVLTSSFPMRHTMKTIRSIKHHLYIITMTKTSLSLFDDKRFWINPLKSVPFGHPDCNKVVGLVHDHAYQSLSLSSSSSS